MCVTQEVFSPTIDYLWLFGVVRYSCGLSAASISFWTSVIFGIVRFFFIYFNDTGARAGSRYLKTKILWTGRSARAIRQCIFFGRHCFLLFLRSEFPAAWITNKKSFRLDVERARARAPASRWSMRARLVHSPLIKEMGGFIDPDDDNRSPRLIKHNNSIPASNCLKNQSRASIRDVRWPRTGLVGGKKKSGRLYRSWLRRNSGWEKNIYNPTVVCWFIAALEKQKCVYAYKTTTRRW